MLFKKSSSNVVNQLGSKSSASKKTFGKKLQEINQAAKQIHDTVDTVHKVKSLLEK